MKNFKTIIAVIAISLSTVFSATANDKNPKTNKETKALRIEMSAFIGKKIPIEIQKSTTVEVSFIINNKNEIVVLTTDSKNIELNSFFKKKLNYKKIVTKGIQKGEVYKIPIKINK
ncbi:hypothetical protein JL193_00680 [Polaribacter batillariae]|uniref:Uncharacterized protein n=1 Tax=Polaribacter batillariae TaxID=2808900 RepID=A0ABX7SY02_9FLAO|nr:hypothetical protein [Polaribacter batillariae]QTD37861.1 hypothetical protein JL193_00680 [Polaribacter batillariae]